MTCLQLVNSVSLSYFNEHVTCHPDDCTDTKLLSLVQDYGDNTVLQALMQVVPPETEFYGINEEYQSAAFLVKVEKYLRPQKPQLP